MRAIAAGVTDIGRQRAHNEDRFILLPEFSVFVVADGMGGHQAGEVASTMAASAIARFFRGGGSDGKDGIAGVRDAVREANARIFSRAEDSRAHRGMGTTIVVAAYRAAESALYVAHAGDSRCYRLRNGELTQLTRDHSLISDALLEQPDLSERELAYLPRNVITRALGIAASIDVDVHAEQVERRDVFLLCSDGLHGLVSDEVMTAIIEQHEPLTDACARLVAKANENGGKDNITAVLIRIEDGDEPWASRNGTEHA